MRKLNSFSSIFALWVVAHKHAEAYAVALAIETTAWIDARQKGTFIIWACLNLERAPESFSGQFRYPLFSIPHIDLGVSDVLVNPR